MWYGQRAFANITPKSLADFFEIVDNGYRPADAKGYKKPPARWKKLMNECWQSNPEERPTAGKCNKEITALSEVVSNPFCPLSTRKVEGII